MKNVIFALTRGYPHDLSKYENLIKRNFSIYENIINKQETPIDMLLFHEGNISINDQEYINSKNEHKIIFKDVSKYFQKVDLKFADTEKFNLGYRLMCKFNMYHLWNEISEYDYALRVDEDINIATFDPFVFEYMKKNKVDFLVGRYSKEIHKVTNNTLPNFLIKNTTLDVSKVYNHRFPYTNLYATSVKFWLDAEVQNLLKMIATSNEQIIYRWGDIPVLGVILNHKNIDIKLFHKLEYNHISHNFKIKNNALRNLIINSKINPISINEGLPTKLKIKIRGKLTSKNPYDFEIN